MLDTELKRVVWDEIRVNEKSTAYILAADPLFAELKGMFGDTAEVEIPLSCLSASLRQQIPRDALAEVVRYIEEPRLDEYNKKMLGFAGANSSSTSE